MTDKTTTKTEEIVASLFHQDPVASAQYFETMRRRSHLEPEKMLMLAVLEDAVFCLKKNLLIPSRKGRRLLRETEDWICEEDNEWPFSFKNICEVLGLDPDYLRRGLTRWRHDRLLQARIPEALQHQKRLRKPVKGAKMNIAA